MPPQIGHDQPVSRREKLRNRKEKFMVRRSGVQQDDWRPAARDVVENFSVVAFDWFHKRIIGKIRKGWAARTQSDRPSRPVSKFCGITRTMQEMKYLNNGFMFADCVISQDWAMNQFANPRTLPNDTAHAGKRGSRSKWSSKAFPKRIAASGSSSAIWPMISARSFSD